MFKLVLKHKMIAEQIKEDIIFILCNQVLGMGEHV